MKPSAPSTEGKNPRCADGCQPDTHCDYDECPGSPRCYKCGVEITTGLMAAFCPKGKECEFYVPGVEEFMEVFK